MKDNITNKQISLGGLLKLFLLIGAVAVLGFLIRKERIIKTANLYNSIAPAANADVPGVGASGSGESASGDCCDSCGC